MSGKLLLQDVTALSGSACAGKSEIGGESPPIPEDIRCRTGIIRTGFGAADFRLNRVIRLANTEGY